MLTGKAATGNLKDGLGVSYLAWDVLKSYLNQGPKRCLCFS